MVELIIRMTPAGEVTVTGPIENRVLAYGLLEIARDVIAEHAKQAEQRVVPASALPPLPPNGGRT